MGIAFNHGMNIHPVSKNRRSIRLKNYDYSKNGGYFVTVCTQDREILFGEIAEGRMKLNRLGEIVDRIWNQLPIHFPNIQLDQFVIMPNHIHGIIIITPIPPPQGAVTAPLHFHRVKIKRNAPNSNGIVGAGFPRPPLPIPIPPPKGAETAPLQKRPLGQMVAYLKYQTTQHINKIIGLPGKRIWQRNYYEHIIRNEYTLSKIRKYIAYNPLRWELDRENPRGTGIDAFDLWLENDAKRTSLL
jgi:REP-associated tyrosine transposase